MKVRYRKIKVKDTVYVFQVPAETPLHAVDIIKAGYMVYIKTGMKPAVNTNDEILGKSGGGFNPIQITETIENNDSEIHILLQNALRRTQTWLEAENNNQPLLPRLAVAAWQGKVIQRENKPTPRYYVNNYVYCCSCQSKIDGRQTLIINQNGKVSNALPFEANDPEVTIAHNGSKRLLCPDCKVKSIVIDDPINPEHETEEFKEKVNRWYDGIMIDAEKKPKKQSPIEFAIEMLEDSELSPDFKCGAAWMFLQMMKEKDSV